MNRQNLILTAFVCAAAVQLAVPLSMIARREHTLRHGSQYRFKTAPVDPCDAFRGRYVAVSVEPNDVAVTNAAAFRRGQRVYVRLDEGTNGFARFSGITRSRPDGDGYIRARASWPQGNRVRLDLPFDRYYMNEAKAPEAEKAYREHSRRTSQDAYVTVRVSSGFAVLEELYVGGKPIREFLGK